MQTGYQTEIVKDCSKCTFKRSMGSRTKGVRIPNGTGKCIRPDGHCDPDIVCGGIGQGPVFRRTAESVRKKADMIRETANYCDDPARFREEIKTADDLIRKADALEAAAQKTVYLSCYLRDGRKRPLAACRKDCRSVCKLYTQVVKEDA